MSTRLIFAITLCIQSSFALAANDLDKWNSPAGREVRTTLKNKTTPTTTYSELPNAVDAQYRSTQNGGKVLQQIEHSATKEGSKVGVTIEALKKVDKAAVAKKWANELFKGGVRFTAGAVLIEVAMQEMLDGLDYIMGEGGKIQLKPTHPDYPALDKNTSPYVYHTSDSQGSLVVVYDINAYCSSVTPAPYDDGTRLITYTFDSSSTVYPSNACVFKRYFDGVLSPPNSVKQFQRYSNPDYNPNSSIESPSPTKQQLENNIKHYLDNSLNTSKDVLIEEAYKPNGYGSIQWSDDPSSKKEIFGNDPQIAKNVYESDNPVGDGLTKSTPQIKDSTVIEGETSPNPNPEPPTIPDPVTGEPIPNPNYNPNLDTGSKTETKLPPACEYFAKLCAWLDWTQEDPPENENEEPQAPSDQGIFDWSFNTDFNLGGQCPGDLSFTWTGKYFAGTHTISLQWLCLIFTFLGYPLVFLSHCIGVWIFYEVASRKELKSGY